MKNRNEIMSSFCYSDEDTIFGFVGNYSFLSNFYPCIVRYKGRIFKCSEAAFMSEKTLDESQKDLISDMDAAESKKFGRKVKLRDDWEKVKCIVMKSVLTEKFKQNPILLNKLKQTGDKEIFEANYWNDRFWGCDPDGVGQNNLGKILMELRKEL
jgi:hypothetical protein